jgi:hypothetical protein
VELLSDWGLLEQVTTSILESTAVASDEICRQLAYYAAKDFANFDVIKLAYSLCTYYEVGPWAGSGDWYHLLIAAVLMTTDGSDHDDDDHDHHGQS